MTITEVTPKKGALSPELVAKLQHRWKIQGQTLSAEQFPMQKGKSVVYRGEVAFRQVGDEKHFDFKGADDMGNRTAWTGIYIFDNGILAICYRVADESGAERPKAFPRRSERPEPGAYFFRLRHDDGETKQPKGAKK